MIETIGDNADAAASAAAARSDSVSSNDYSF